MNYFKPRHPTRHVNSSQVDVANLGSNPPVNSTIPNLNVLASSDAIIPDELDTRVNLEASNLSELNRSVRDLTGELRVLIVHLADREDLNKSVLNKAGVDVLVPTGTQPILFRVIVVGVIAGSLLILLVLVPDSIRNFAYPTGLLGFVINRVLARVLLQRGIVMDQFPLAIKTLPQPEDFVYLSLHKSLYTDLAFVCGIVSWSISTFAVTRIVGDFFQGFNLNTGNTGHTPNTPD